jgi:hypothetical protein
MQILGNIPAIGENPWLLPVGQAYKIELNQDVDDERFITLSYLQRDVPEGYEHTLTVYFLPDGESKWQRLETQRYVENMVVTDLENRNGTYAVMATIEMPELQPGWNMFAYTLPVTRSVTETLRSINGLYTTVSAAPPGSDETEDVSEFEFGNVYWIEIGGEDPVVPYIAPPKQLPDGTIQ